MPFDEVVIARIKKLDHIDPGLYRFVVSQRDPVFFTEPHGGWADLLAVVTPVKPIAECLAKLHRECAWLLNKPRKTAVRVDNARRNDGACRATVEASAARAATIGERLSLWVIGGRDDAAEYEKTSSARQHDVGILAEPTETTEVRDLAVDDRVVIGVRHGALVGPADASGDKP